MSAFLTQALRVVALPATAFGASASGSLLPALALVIALKALENSRQ